MKVARSLKSWPDRATKVDVRLGKVANGQYLRYLRYLRYLARLPMANIWAQMLFHHLSLCIQLFLSWATYIIVSLIKEITVICIRGGGRLTHTQWCLSFDSLASVLSQHITRIANAVQHHSELWDNKNCHELIDSTVSNDNNFTLQFHMYLS